MSNKELIFRPAVGVWRTGVGVGGVNSVRVFPYMI